MAISLPLKSEMILVDVKPQWLQTMFFVLLALIVFCKSTVLLATFSDGIVGSLELKRSLTEGRGRGNSLEEDSSRIICHEVALNCCFSISLAVVVFVLSTKLDIVTTIVVNGGVLGTIICLIVPCVAYKTVIHQEGREIPFLEACMLNILLIAGCAFIFKLFFAVISKIS